MEERKRKLVFFSFLTIKTFLCNVRRKRNIILSEEQLPSYGFLQKFWSHITIKDQDTDSSHTSYGYGLVYDVLPLSVQRTIGYLIKQTYFSPFPNTSIFGSFSVRSVLPYFLYVKSNSSWVLWISCWVPSSQGTYRSLFNSLICQGEAFLPHRPLKCLSTFSLVLNIGLLAFCSLALDIIITNNLC